MYTDQLEDDIERLEERVRALEAALQSIADFHIGDCPAAVEEVDFAKNINREIRKIARAALLKAQSGEAQ